MIKGLVSTIIPVYNRAAMLNDAVNSVLQQTYRPIEIIIVDDGSTDETVQVAQKFSETHQEITLIQKNNSGPGLSREAGRRAANGEYIQYLDSDDLLLPDKFSQQVQGLQDNLNCDISYCLQHYCDVSGEVIDSAWMRTDEQHATLYPAMLAGRLWGTSAPLYRRILTDKIGPWADLHNEEDWEYDCRAGIHNVKLHYIGQHLVTERTHSQGHYGHIDDHDNRKLSDRARSYLLIANHAYLANINAQTNEFQHFIRRLFLVCRQCSARGLTQEARQLFNIVKTHPTNTFKQRLEYYAYQLASLLFGWQRVGRWSQKLDRLRP